MTALAVAAAGALGAATRYVVDALVANGTSRALPWGTLVVNVVGSLVAGVVAGLVLFAGHPSTVRLVAGIGFAGSFTTFSTFALETVRLAGRGAWSAALANVAANLLASLAAAVVGLSTVAALA